MECCLAARRGARALYKEASKKFSLWRLIAEEKVLGLGRQAARYDSVAQQSRVHRVVEILCSCNTRQLAASVMAKRCGDIYYSGAASPSGLDGDAPQSLGEAS